MSARETCGSIVAIVAFAMFVHASPATAGPVDVVEFHHAAFDHYFITADPVEIGKLDSGEFTGWQRTGLSFKGLDAGDTSPGARPVCRFYGLPSAGLDSHFYSASATECDEVKIKFPLAWLYESGNVFGIYLPDLASGQCPANTIPVYRSWNGRSDSNHRYTTSTAVHDAMIAQGLRRRGLRPAPATGRDVRADPRRCRAAACVLSASSPTAPGRRDGAAQRQLHRQSDRVQLDRLHERRPAVHGDERRRRHRHVLRGRHQRLRRQRAGVRAGRVVGAAAAAPAGRAARVHDRGHGAEPDAGGRFAGRPRGVVQRRCRRLPVDELRERDADLQGPRQRSRVADLPDGRRQCRRQQRARDRQRELDRVAAPAAGLCAQEPSLLFSDVGSDHETVHSAYAESPGFAWNGAWVVRFTVPATAHAGQSGFGQRGRVRRPADVPRADDLDDRVRLPRQATRPAPTVRSPATSALTPNIYFDIGASTPGIAGPGARRHLLPQRPQPLRRRHRIVSGGPGALRRAGGGPSAALSRAVGLRRTAAPLRGRERSAGVEARPRTAPHRPRLPPSR